MKNKKKRRNPVRKRSALSLLFLFLFRSLRSIFFIILALILAIARYLFLFVKKKPLIAFALLFSFSIFSFVAQNAFYTQLDAKKRLFSDKTQKKIVVFERYNRERHVQNPLTAKNTKNLAKLFVKETPYNVNKKLNSQNPQQDSKDTIGSLIQLHNHISLTQELSTIKAADMEKVPVPNLNPLKNSVLEPIVSQQKEIVQKSSFTNAPNVIKKNDPAIKDDRRIDNKTVFKQKTQNISVKKSDKTPLSLTEEEIRHVQKALQAFGDVRLRVTGKIDTQTLEAVKNFKKIFSLSEGKDITKEMISKMQEIGILN